MTYLIIYLLKVLVIQGALFLFYWFFLKNTRRHQLNRMFLLMGLMIAFAIPFIELPKPENLPVVSQNEQVITWLTETNFDYEMILLPVEKEATNWSFWLAIPFIYGLVTMIFLIQSVLSLYALSHLKKQSEAIKKHWFNLFKTTYSRPFSFFSNVFIPKTLFDSEDFDQVLAHECVHVKQHHSLDRLLLDFVVSLFWFNPFMYLYRNALIEIHEYQADEEVVSRFKDPIHYQEILFSQLQSPQYSGMVSHFNVSTIKKRIVMINKKQNKKSGFIYLVALPLSLMMIFAFSSKEAMRPIEKVGNEIANKMEPALSFDFPKIEVQNDFKPSISPIEKTDLVRLHSDFGMRTHPIYKVKKMHLGVDFSCKIGSQVVATADGIVDEIKTTFDGYGKMISIDHDGKYQTRYAQLSEFSVKKGDRVKKGQLIGLSGNSGASTAPHLHYEVIETGKGHVDPKPFIKNYKFKIQIKEIPVKDDSDDSERNVDERKKQNDQYEEQISEWYKARKSYVDSLSSPATILIDENIHFTVDGVSMTREEVASSLSSHDVNVVKFLQPETAQKKYDDQTLDGAVEITVKSRISESHKDLIDDEKKISFQDSNQEFRLRLDGEGSRSLLNGEMPLYVLDGKILKKEEFEDISTSNIEHIEIFKDQKAIDKYGKKGGNGVIKITTKTKDKKKNKGKQKEKDKSKQQAFRVIIDPGHGGVDSGELYANDLHEKNLVLSIAEKIKREFNDQAEIEILLTRDGDEFVSLVDRKSSAENADLFISLHSQGYNDSFGRDILLMYSNANYYYDRSKQIATVLNEEFNELNKGECSLASFSSDGEGVNEYWLLNNVEVPAVMVQLNLQEEKVFDIDESAIAARIATSIRIAAF